MFMDATHPQHNPVIACGWIKRGKEHPIKSNTGRRRLNINGAIDVQRMSAEIRFDDTIDAISTIALFEQIERANPLAKRITIICDNARYYRSKAVAEYLENSRINLLFSPPYSPNLNLIELFLNSSSAKCFSTATMRRSTTIETLASAFSVNSIHSYRSYARCRRKTSRSSGIRKPKSSICWV